MGPVKKANKLDMTSGPTMDVMLITLVKDPWSSPCSLDGTDPEIMACRPGPEIPPKQYGTKKANIIQLCEARPNKTNPMVYKPKPRYTLFSFPILGFTNLTSTP
jgi:hypothetical protein